MQIYGKKAECSGCGACAQICPVKCVSMEVDKEGFVYPIIDEKRCIRCGKCKELCSMIGHQYPALYKEVYAAQNKNNRVRMESSSGGVFGVLAKYTLQNGGKVYGAVYDDSLRIIHLAITNEKELEMLYGSKYAQSDLGNTFSLTLEDLKAGTKVLFSGTPCQIASLRQFLQDDYENLICVAVICHGVNSPKVLAEHIRFKEYAHHGEKLTRIKFRDKTQGGWKNAGSVLYKYGNSFQEYIGAQDDIFFKGFLKNLFLRPSCYQCRVKENGIHFGADIILGDYWGIEKTGSSLSDNKGTSAVILCTEKGKEIFEKISAYLDAERSELEQVLKGNSCLLKSVKRNGKRERFFSELEDTGNIERSILDNIDPPHNAREGDQYHYQIALQYLKNKIDNKNICDFFVENHYGRIALYAITDFTKLLFKDIQNNNQGIKILYFSDLNSENYSFGYQGLQVVKISKMVEDCKNGRLDCVVIGYPAFENIIIDDLIKKGCPQDKLLSIGSVVFGAGE